MTNGSPASASSPRNPSWSPRHLAVRAGQQQWMARAWPTTVVLNLPTAQALLVEVAVTPDRRLLFPPGAGGLGTCIHVVPFQCRMRAWAVLLIEKPTAQALLAEVAATLARSLSFPGLGLATCAHLRPSQCRMRVFSPRPLESSPTAQASLAEVAATPPRSLKAPGLGLATCFQV